MKEDIRITLRDAREIGPDLIERVGDLFVSHRDISFQDMQSISRCFRDCFAYERPKDEVVNDIIVSQACRHVCVHSGGTVDRRMVGQVRTAVPRTLKPEIAEGHKVRFTDEEIALVGQRMTTYLQDLALGISA